MIRKSIISWFLTFFICLSAFSQGIYISPSSAEQGDYLSVDVYGNNQSDFQNLCSWGLDCCPELKLYNSSTGDSIGLYNEADMMWGGQSFPTSLSIPINADTGMYHLQKRDCNGNWQTIAFNFFEVLPDVVQPPQITSIDPSSGGQRQILQVTITGSDIDFGQYSNTYSDFRFSHSQWSGTNMFYGQSHWVNQTTQGTQLSGYVSIPQNQPTGQYDLEVYDYNTQNWVMMSSAFYVTPGNISGISISPSSAEQGDYLSVDVYGNYRTDFQNLCSWGLDCCPELKLYNSSTGDSIGLYNEADMMWGGQSFPTSLSIPINADTGMYHLQKRDCNGNWQTIAFNFFEVLPDVVQPPQITSIDPSSGNLGEILQVTITGSDIDFGQYSNTYSDFRFSQWSGTNMFYGQSHWANQTTQGTQLSGYVSIPQNQPTGQYDLEVFDYNTASWIMLNNAFEVQSNQPQPQIDWINPNNGNQGQTLSVNISGTNMVFGDQWSSVSSFRFSQWSGSNMFYGFPSYESGNNLYGTVSIPSSQNTGWYDLEVYDIATGNWVMLNNAFEVQSNQPQIDWINPNNGQQGQTLSVNISGTNMDYGDQWSGTLSDFRFSQWSGSNMFYGSPSYESGNNLYGTVSIPSSQNTGWYDLEVWDNATSNWVMLSNAFEVQSFNPNPQVNSISPSSGNQGQTLSVNISGTNMDYGDQWSGTLSDFRFSQWSGSNMFYGNTISENGTNLYGNVNIPLNQPTGQYDLEVYDYNTHNWVMMPNAFNVYSSNSNNSGAIWEEDFANGFPNGWVTYSNNTQGGPATCKWKWSTVGSWGYWQGTQGQSPAQAINSTTAANGFLISDTDSANHHAYGQPSGSTYQYIDSYFITDAIDLSNYHEVTLEFEHSFRYNNWGNTSFIPPSVWISNDSTTWTQFIVNNNIPNNTASADPEYVRLDIGAIAGNQTTVYIKVGWTSRCYYWMLDDMKIIETPPNALEMQNENFGGWLLGNPNTTGDMGIPYTFNPINQAQNNPYRLEAQIINKGSNIQTNTQLNVSINGGGSFWSGSSNPTNLAPNDTITVATQNTFSPTNLGPHRVGFWVSSDSIPFMSTSLTDTAWRQTIVTDTVYGRDYDWNSDGANLSTNGYELQNSQCGQVLVNAFEFYAVDTITSISFFVNSNSQAGANLMVVLYEYDNTQSPNANPPFLLASSDPYQLDTSDIGVWKTIKFEHPLITYPGQTLLAGVQGFQGPQVVEISYSGDDGAVSYIQDNGCNYGGGGLGYWYTTRTNAIRLNTGRPSQITSGPSWNCNNGFCVDPGDGSGMYNTLSSCQNSCVQSSIDSILPNSGNPGEQLLNVVISGTEMNFGNQWSGTLSQFIFTNSIDSTNQFYGNPTSSSNNFLYGDINIPINQTSGWYDLEVYNNNTYQWVTLNNAFYVNDIGYGCTDSNASNYNPSALIDDGSCMISLCDSSNYFGPPVVNFTKPNYADWNNLSFRDVITSNCQLTRKDNGGLYNYLTQSDWSSNDENSGVLYAAGDFNSNGPYLGSYPFNNNHNHFNPYYNSNYYSTMQDAIGPIGNYLSQPGQIITIHLPYENLYFELEFNSWSCCNQGGYSYTRTWVPCIEVPLVYGCMDTSASNYNFSASYDDGSCYYLGCMDSLSVNYNPQATIDDGSCKSLTSIHPNNGLRGQVVYVGIEGQNIQYNAFTQYANIFPQLSGFRLSQGGNNIIYGNPNQTFANYLTGDISIPINQPTGWYDLEVYDFETNSWVVGHNFFEIIDFIYGCTDPNSLNYDSTATIDNGSCIQIIYGCMDLLASNYDPSAMIDDGTCQYVYGCTDPLAFNYNSNAVFDDSSCIAVVYGCTDALSCNYNSFANTIDTCIYSEVPNGLFVTNVQLNRATLNWNSSINSIDYEIRFRDLGSSWNSINVGFVSSFSLLNLNSSTTYEFQIRSICSNDSLSHSNWSPIDSFNTWTPCSTPTNAVTINTGATFATVSWNPVIDTWGYRIRYKKVSDPFSSFVYDTTTSSSYTISGLNIGTDYHWQVRAMCQETAPWNNSGFTGKKPFTTLSFSNNNPVILPYDSITECFSYTWNGTVYNQSGTYNYIINSIPQDSVFTLVLTIDPNPCISAGNVCSEPIPSGLFVDNIFHDRVTINWDDMNSNNCVVDQYRIKYREVGSVSWNQKTMGQPEGSCLWPCNKEDKLLLGLLPETTYEYQIRAWYCGGGNSAWSSIHNFTTLPLCPNIANLSVNTPTTTKATFTWDDSNGSYSFVRIKARIDNVIDPSSSDWFNIGGSGVTYPIFAKNKHNLIPGETYRAQARTWCDPNGGAYKSESWSPLVYWTMPSQRLEIGATITNLDVYPNPSNNLFSISFNSEKVQDLQIRILNLIGEIIMDEQKTQFVGEYVKTIDLEGNPKGIYLLEIETNSGVVNKKLILQ